VEAFVRDAPPELVLNAGYDRAISVRGGPSVNEELKKLGRLPVGQAVITGAGGMKAKHIIHANGPKFQEEDEEGKLRRAVLASLRLAEQRGVKQIAFPPMGTGFYVVPMDLCVRVMMETVKEYLKGDTKIEEVIFVGVDLREFKPLEAYLASMGE
jgi:O-acetyl-ADP-ribose deacetylase (regulator of RNase III)